MPIREVTFSTKFRKAYKKYRGLYKRKALNGKLYPFSNPKSITLEDVLVFRVTYVLEAIATGQTVDDFFSPHPYSGVKGLPKNRTRWDFHIFNDLVLLVDYYKSAQTGIAMAEVINLGTHPELRIASVQPVLKKDL